MKENRRSFIRPESQLNFKENKIKLSVLFFGNNHDLFDCGECGVAIDPFDWN